MNIVCTIFRSNGEVHSFFRCTEPEIPVLCRHYTEHAVALNAERAVFTHINVWGSRDIKIQKLR